MKIEKLGELPSKKYDKGFTHRLFALLEKMKKGETVTFKTKEENISLGGCRFAVSKWNSEHEDRRVKLSVRYARTENETCWIYFENVDEEL